MQFDTSINYYTRSLLTNTAIKVKDCTATLRIQTTEKITMECNDLVNGRLKPPFSKGTVRILEYVNEIKARVVSVQFKFALLKGHL